MGIPIMYTRDLRLRQGGISKPIKIYDEETKQIRLVAAYMLEIIP